MTLDLKGLSFFVRKSRQKYFITEIVSNFSDGVQTYRNQLNDSREYLKIGNYGPAFNSEYGVYLGTIRRFGRWALNFIFSLFILPDFKDNKKYRKRNDCHVDLLNVVVSTIFNKKRQVIVSQFLCGNGGFEDNFKMNICFLKLIE